MYKLTGSTLAVGLISLTHLVPLLTLTVIGGAIADAVDRSRLMLVQQIGMIAGSIGLAANAALSHPHIWALYAFQLLISSAFSIGVGAQRSMTPQLVDEQNFMAASALNSVTSQFGAVAGPAFAGILIKYVDLKWIYLGDAASYVGAIVAVSRLPRLVARADADRPSLRSIAAGSRRARCSAESRGSSSCRSRRLRRWAISRRARSHVRRASASRSSRAASRASSAAHCSRWLFRRSSVTTQARVLRRSFFARSVH